MGQGLGILNYPVTPSDSELFPSGRVQSVLRTCPGRYFSQSTGEYS